MKQPQQRIATLDLLRGLAVFFMILAHSVYFLSSRRSALLLSMENFGNTISFVVFLLVAGAVAVVAYGTVSIPKRKRMLTHAFVLLVSYYTLACVVVADRLAQADLVSKVRLLGDILFFRFFPGFTEYLPAFIFLSFLLALAPGFFRRATATVPRLLVVSLATFFAGFALYHLPVNEFFKPWVAILSGGHGLFRFPLLQYLPVYLVGMFWGRILASDKGRHEKRVLVFDLAFVFSVFALASLLVTIFFHLSLPTVFSRWPPSLPFLSVGLGFAFFAAFLLTAIHSAHRQTLLHNFFVLLGQNALALFWSHVFLLSMYAMAGGTKVSSVLIFTLLFLLVLLLSLALATFLPFNFRLAVTFLRGSREEHEEALERETVFTLGEAVAADLRKDAKILRRRHKVALGILGIALVGLLSPSVGQELARNRQQRSADVWWNESYAYRQKVSLKTENPFLNVEVGDVVSVSFDHAQLASEKKSREDGADVKMVYWDGKQHVVADGTVLSPTSDHAVLVFQSPVVLQAGRENPFFFLYYGNALAAPMSPPLTETNNRVVATFAPEEPFPLLATVSKNWNLLGTDQENALTLRVKSAATFTAPVVTYHVLGTNVTGAMQQMGDQVWEANIDTSTLSPGEYQAQATLRDGKRSVVSQKSGWHLSYPFFVAWTEDWEGYGVQRTYLNAMEDISTRFHIPITHFFNPRIYVTKTIGEQEAAFLTDWVKRRLTQGDALGLHLHMLYDWVTSAGVTPKNEPNWGDNGDGYGVPLSAYSEEEQQQMIEKAVALLVAHGFARPTLFRAGGWFADLDTFAALQATGFQADSSARTPYAFGANELEGPWQITATTPPYYPSKDDQNRSSTNNFSVLEIPNNGADSYAFSADEMISRFTENDPSGVLEQPRQVTYLSHPHWFDEKEQTRIIDVFSFLMQRSFADDRGPVIFTTTDKIYQAFAAQ